MDAMKLILSPSDLDPSSAQDVLYGGAIELSEFFVELSIRLESFPEGVDCSFLIAKWNGEFLSIKASNVVAK